MISVAILLIGVIVAVAILFWIIDSFPMATKPPLFVWAAKAVVLLLALMVVFNYWPGGNIIGR